MGKGRNPYILDQAKEDISSLCESESREALRNLGSLVREMDGFVTVNEVTGDMEMSLTEVLADARAEGNAKTRGYIIGKESGHEYHVLTLGSIQSFASFVGETLIVLWFGSSKLKHDEQEQAKEIAVSRLRNYLEGVDDER